VAEVIVRPYEDRDLAEVHAILTCPGVWPHLATDATLSREALLQRLRGAAGQNVHHLVAEVGGRVLGTARLRVWSEARFRHSANLTISVHDDARGQGVGKALMRALCALADGELALARIQLEVDADNTAAIALYQKMGFEPEGRLRGFKLRDGTLIDALVMARVRL
jgi:putative acetyltransferase